MAELKFRVIEVDPSTGEIEGDEEGFAEEYPLEDIEIATADFMNMVRCMSFFVGIPVAQASVEDFRLEWDSLSRDVEILQKFALHFKEMRTAIAGVITLLGMQ